jgi:hypothetical protein
VSQRDNVLQTLMHAWPCAHLPDTCSSHGEPTAPADRMTSRRQCTTWVAALRSAYGLPHTHAHTCPYKAHTRAHTNAHTHTHTYMRTYTQARTEYIHTHTCAHIHMHTHTQIVTHAHIYTGMHTARTVSDNPPSATAKRHALLHAQAECIGTQRDCRNLLRHMGG